MSKSNFIQDESSMKKAPTLVRRVSDMFKDGSYSGPPLLIRHTSMEKIRHCCQNLNLLPYLLYSLKKSRSHPLAKRASIHFDRLLKKLVERTLFIYMGFHQILLSTILQKLPAAPVKVENEQSEIKNKRVRLYKPQKPKPKQTSILLVIAVYLIPLVLALQLVGLGSLLLFGKHTPGFIFLVASLLFLSYIATKVMFHTKIELRTTKQKKKKAA